MLSDLTLAHIDYGCRLFPVDGRKHPLVKGWPAAATTDVAFLEMCTQRWPYCQWGWALPASVLGLDIDVKGSKRGFEDFKRLDGRDPRTIVTPAMTTPSGGLIHFYGTGGRIYKNLVAIGGTGLDTRSAGGFVAMPDVLPDGRTNGREWLVPLITPMLPVPEWVSRYALKQEPPPRPAHDLPPSACDLPPLSDDPRARDFARVALGRACMRITRAPCGAQDATRNRETFFVGTLVARGLLAEAEALDALVRAACAMPTYREPWRDLEKRVRSSFEAGVNNEGQRYE